MPDSPIEDFEYEFKDGEVKITKYIGTDRKIRIPAEIKERPVTVIGEEAFCEYDLTYIYIPDSVTLIEESAFWSCECLEEISFPASLEVIGKSAFEYCDGLTTLVLPENLRELHDDAFYGCSSLKEVHLPQSLSEIGSYAFAYCEALEIIQFAEGLKTIHSGAFNECTKLSGVELPESLIYLGVYSFEDCDSLQYLRIPSNTSIGIETESRYISAYGITYHSVSCPVGLETWYSGSSLLDETQTSYAPFYTVLIVSEGSTAHHLLLSCEYSGEIIQYRIG